MNFRVQRFHPAVEHFGKAGVVGHFDYRHAGIGQHFGGAAGRKNFHAELIERLGKFNHAAFVGQADEGTFYNRHKWAPFID